jgi:hypothetical protein
MICAGLLVLVSSGLCTGYFSFFPLADMIGSSPSSYAGEVVWFALVLGGPPILMGIVPICVGMRLNRS